MRLTMPFIFVAALLAGGCTTMQQQTELSPDELRAGIRDDGLLKQGDKVAVATEDQRTHEFRVTQVTQDVIRGENRDGDVEIPINEVIGVRTREISAGRTTALAGAAVGGVAVFGFVLAGGLAAALVAALGG